MHTIFTFLVFWILFVTGVQAQVVPANLHDYSIAHYTDENGLSQNSIKSIYKCHNGFLWLLTENGILRYDGTKFNPISDSTNMRRGIRYTSLHVINRPGQEKIFAQSDNLQYLRIYHNYMVSDSTIEDDLPEEFSIRHFPGIYRTSGTPDSHYSFNIPHTLIIPVTEEEGSFYTIRSNSVDFYKNHQQYGHINYAFTNLERIFKLNKKLYYHRPDNSFDCVSEKSINRIQVNGDILSNPGFHNRGNLIVFWNNNNDQVFFSLDDVIYHVEANSNGSLNTTLILSGFNTSKQYINQIYYNKKQQRIALGSLTNGLYMLKRKRFLNLRIGDSEIENVYYGQIPYGKNSILTPQGIVLGYDTLNDTTTAKVLPEINNFRSWDRYVIFRDKKNYIWVKRGNSLFKFDSLGQRNLMEANLNEEINIIHQESSGRVWVGTKKSGLYDFVPEDTEVRFRKRISNLNGVVNVIQNAGPDTMMIGTNNGLYRLIVSSNKLERINYFNDKNVRNLYIPEPGQVWINTYGQGSYLMLNGRVTAFPNDEKGYLLYAHCTFEDRKGFIWITTNKGLFRISKSDLFNYAASDHTNRIWYDYFSKDEGFGTNEFNGGCQPCALRVSNDYVSLPSLNGMVWFKPEEIDSEPPLSSIFLDNVSVNKGTYTVEGDTIYFSESDIQAVLDISTPYFGDPYNLCFEYHLSESGSNPEKLKWIKIDPKNSKIHLPQLDAGDYNLVIRKFSGSGMNNFDYITFSLIVPSPWYESNWIYVLLGIASLLALYFIANLRSRYLQRKNLNLEKLVRQRTQELNATLEELRISQADVTWQSFINGQIIASISHDVKTPLKYLTRLTDNMYLSMVGTKDADMIEISKASRDTSKRLYYLISNLMEYVKGNNLTDGHIQKEYINFSKLVSTKAQLFEETTHTNLSTVINQIPEGFTLFSSPELLGIIVQNLIDNAIKASPRGIVKIMLAETDDPQHDVILFFNTGSFMPSSLLKWFNEYTPSLQKNPHHNLLPKHNGLGLVIIKQIASLLQIEINARSSAETGTEISLKIRKHYENPANL